MKPTNDFMSIAKSFYKKTMDMPTITSDDFRMMKLDKRLGESRMLIGSFFQYMHKAGMTTRTGKTVPTMIKSSNGRRIAVWKWSKNVQMMMS